MREVPCPARHELDEERADRHTGERPEAADDCADDEQQRLVEVKRGRTDEPVRDEDEERAAHARVEAADSERERLVERSVDARRSGRDLAVAERSKSAAR